MMEREPRLHIVVVGRFVDALTDWQGELVSLDRQRLLGVDRAGRRIRFVSVEDPERLRGLRADSWEFHTPTTTSMRLVLRREVYGVMHSRMIPYKETHLKRETAR
jgi:hypothetical protein